MKRVWIGWIAGGALAAALAVQVAQAKTQERHLGGMLRFGQDIEVAAKDVVDGPVIAFNGSVMISGKVEGPVIALGGSVRLNQGAKVDGPVLVSRGTISLDSNSHVEGPLLELPKLPWRKIGMLIGSIFGMAGGFWLAYKILGALGSIAVAALLWILFPKALENSRQSLEARPGFVSLAGILFWPCLVILGLVLLISLVGIPLLPLLILVVVGVWCWGFTTLGFWIGHRLSAGLWKNSLVSVLAGTVLLRALHWIPLVQVLVCLAVAIAGVGATVASRFGTRPLRTQQP